MDDMIYMTTISILEGIEIVDYIFNKLVLLT